MRKPTGQWLVGALAGLAILSLESLALAQGSLTPPGPPAPTMKTLAQIEPRTPISSLPYTISNSGSYYVTTNLIGTAGQSGIVIFADNVTLDLMGFELVGGPGTGSGIQVNGARRGLILRNGSIRAWGVAGVAATVSDSRVESIRASENGDRGISLANLSDDNAHNQIIGCQAISNGLAGSAAGIETGRGALVKECAAAFNIGGGISVGSGSVVQSSVCTSNSTTGFNTGTGSALAHCVASGNGGRGFVGTVGLTVVNCSAQNNGLDGILAEQATIADCTASGNAGHGIAVLSNALVRACSVTGNQQNGILVLHNNQVLNNTCVGNGNAPLRAGIRIEGNGNRIEGNLATGNNEDGIASAASAQRNTVVRNTASANVGYQYRVPGIPGQPPTGANIVGPIVSDATNTTANAWANFQP